ncbi:MAG: Cys-Gln thioester bond-forming surface protein [Clostridia bacterium]|nr:Cys-Gln thioester bond-forming surface protein [Clostridia bacterium]
MKKSKKIICVIMLILAIFQIALQMNKSKAATIGDINYLERENKGFYSIQSWNGSEWIYVTYSITHYTDEQGVKRIAYCINPDLKGIGWIKGEYEGYDVKLQELLSDEKLWRVYTNGYPYKTPSEIGVETEEDAYLATKMASYCILRSYTVQDVRNLYRAGTTKVENETLEDIQRRGTKVIEAICSLVDKGYNGTETMQYNNILQINKQGELKKDNTNENYYSVTCNVTSKVECSEYKISEISEFPEGTYIANEEGKIQTEFNGNQKFKVMIPKESIIENVAGTINVKGKCKNYPIYYAECMVGNYQNYMLCCDTYSNDVQATCSIEINANKAGLQIEKIDKDTKTPIAGVKFSIKYEEGTELGLYETDEKGKINIQNIKPGNIQITEVETNENYILDSKTNNLKLEYDEIKKITLENEKKKASIKIIKVDANDNTIRIPGAKFEIYNENNELVETIITDENGEATVENLPINVKYTIKEVETAKDYILSDESVTIQLEENEIKTLTFKNKKKEQEAEKLPRTGMIDISNYLIGISVAGIVLNKRILRKIN